MSGNRTTGRNVTDRNDVQVTFDLAAQELKSQAHPGGGGPVRVDPDETGQQGLHRPQLGRVVIAVTFEYLARGEEQKKVDVKRYVAAFS